MSDTLMDPLNCLIYGVAGRLVARSGARTVSPLDNLYGRPRLRLRFFLSVLVTTSARGSGSACESDGDDSDGQGAPQGGGGVQSTPVSARAAEILRGLRGLEASFMRK